MAESVNGLYKSELIDRPDRGRWCTVENVEVATLRWVHWHNTERLHGYLSDGSLAEFGAPFLAPEESEFGSGADAKF